MARPPSWSLCSPLNGCCYSHGHPEQMVRTKVVAQGSPCVYRAHRAQTLCPSDLQSLPVGQEAQSARHSLWVPVSSHASGSVTPRQEWAVEAHGHLAPKQHGDTPQCLLCSHASAPGVPGGSASAEAVASLPGTVDEAQGVFEFLLDGSFMNRLVREVNLVDGFPPRAQGSQEPVQF